MGLTKPETRKVAMQLTSDNKLGYRSQKGGPVSKGSLLQYVIEQKEKHPTKVGFVPCRLRIQSGARLSHGQEYIYIMYHVLCW